MGRYLGPKGRVNRRLNFQVFETNGAIKALEKRNYPPGMHNRRGKMSTYGAGFQEKQKIKFYYGLRDGQLRGYFKKASRMEGNTGEQMLLLCERRLDNVIRRAGFTATRMQSRQGVVHSHFQVDGRKVNKPGFLVRPGDVIEVRNRKNLQKMYREIVDGVSTQPVSFINFESDHLRAVVTGYPSAPDISLPVEVGTVVEFLNR